MRRIRVVGLCLVAVFALGAFTAGSASALPEIGRCVAKAGGKYTNANCTTKKAGGTFEFVKNAVKKKFTAASIAGKIQLEGAGGTAITCTSQSATGEYLEKGATPSTKEVHNVVAKFNGCEIPLFGAKCQSTATEGEIVTTKLKGAMEYISGKKTPAVVVGQALSPEVKKKGFALFKCPAVGVEVYVGEGPGKGHETVIADFTKASVDAMSLHSVEEYKGTKGVQEPDHKEGSAVIDNLESSLSGPKGTFEKSDQELNTEVTNEEELELLA
jgi:hypothetical protein